MLETGNPVSMENLHNNRGARYFWCNVQGRGVFSDYGSEVGGAGSDEQWYFRFITGSWDSLPTLSCSGNFAISQFYPTASTLPSDDSLWAPCSIYRIMA